ncbi:unnamed protein product [Musa textilis]
MIICMTELSHDCTFFAKPQTLVSGPVEFSIFKTKGAQLLYTWYEFSADAH